jgi:hypothetical protein
MSQEDNRTLTGRVGRLFRKISARPANQDRTVSVGQRYFRVTQTAPVWVVRKVYTPDGHTIPHVVLEKIDRPADQNLIAIDRLLDETDYRPDRRAYRSSNMTGRTRRRRDDPKQVLFR